MMADLIAPIVAFFLGRILHLIHGSKDSLVVGQDWVPAQP